MTGFVKTFPENKSSQKASPIEVSQNAIYKQNHVLLDLYSAEDKLHKSLVEKKVLKSEGDLSNCPLERLTLMCL